jgi:hypothetical protein
MTSIAANLTTLKKHLPNGTTLVAVSKFKSIEEISEAYDAGHVDFGENYVQELCSKQKMLRENIKWHFIGKLQSNKVKNIVPFIHLIHSVDNLKLLKEINKEAQKINRVVSVLLQIFIAKEETKSGLSEEEFLEIIQNKADFPFIHIKGLMGMATFTNDSDVIRSEFTILRKLFEKHFDPKNDFLSMGMSSDYEIALKMGSNLLRIGTAIFGKR